MPHLNGMGRVMLPCSLHMLRQEGGGYRDGDGGFLSLKTQKETKKK